MKINTGKMTWTAGTTNPGVTWKPDDTLKGIRNQIPQKLDNPLKVIWDILPNGIWSQWLIGLIVHT